MQTDESKQLDSLKKLLTKWNQKNEEWEAFANNKEHPPTQRNEASLLKICESANAEFTKLNSYSNAIPFVEILGSFNSLRLSLDQLYEKMDPKYQAPVLSAPKQSGICVDNQSSLRNEDDRENHKKADAEKESNQPPMTPKQAIPSSVVENLAANHNNVHMSSLEFPATPSTPSLSDLQLSDASRTILSTIPAHNIAKQQLSQTETNRNSGSSSGSNNSSNSSSNNNSNSNSITNNDYHSNSVKTLKAENTLNNDIAAKPIVNSNTATGGNSTIDTVAATSAKPTINSVPSSMVITNNHLIPRINQQEYESLPAYLTAQISLDEINHTVENLEKIMGNQELTEKIVEDAVQNSNKAKAILLLLMKLNRLKSKRGDNGIRIYVLNED